MKILILNYEYPPLGGGGGRVSQNLAEEWSRQGHQIDIITSHFKNLKKFEQINGVNIYRVPILGRKDLYTATFLSMFSYLITGFLKGFRLCIKEKYNIINTHFAIPTGPLGVLLSKIFKIKNALDLHGGDVYNPSRKISPHKNLLYKKIVQWVLNSSDKIIAHSEDIKEKALKFYKPNKEIKIIPIGFRPFKFKKISREKLGLDENKFYLISVGRLIPRKKVNCTIELLAQLNNSDIELLIIGSGPEKGKLENLSFQLNIKEKIHFLGPVCEEKKFQYLSCADAFISTAEHEGFGITFLEAIYCGLPIISSRCGGPESFLKEGENVLFFDLNDYSTAISAILKLKNDKNFVQKMRQNNLKKNKAFDITIIATRYLELFKL